MNKKQHLAFNFSNQGNLFDTRNTTLSQYNLGVVLGLGFLNNITEPGTSTVEEKVPISLRLNKLGELEINGITEINEENISIYSDKKVSKS